MSQGPGALRRLSTQGPALVIVALLCQEVGASLAVLVFPVAGPVGMVAIRLWFSAIVLWIIVRPKLRGLSRAAWRTVLGYGVVLTAMNLTFYLSLDRLPLGTAVTLEVLGPLVLSVIMGRRWLSLLWALVAFGGVVLLGWQPGAEPLDPLGVAFALAAAVMWATYIVFTKRTTEHFAGMTGFTLGMSVGAIVVTPLAVMTTGAALFEPNILLIGCAIALLSSAIPYGLEMRALRVLPASTFSVLLALAPAIAALTGAIILQQHLTLAAYLGIMLVTAAGIGAVLARRPSA